MDSTFKKCFSPGSFITGNRVKGILTLVLIPNPLMTYITSDNMCQIMDGKVAYATIMLETEENTIAAYPSMM